MFAKLLVPLDRSLLAEEAIGQRRHLRGAARRSSISWSSTSRFHMCCPRPLWTEAGINDGNQQYIEQIARRADDRLEPRRDLRGDTRRGLPRRSACAPQKFARISS